MGDKYNMVETKNLSKGKEELIKRCFEDFGHMNKNDYEVALFHLLTQNGYDEKSDFELSVKLKIPESKVKRLRYEEGLVYQKKPEELKKQFYMMAKKSTFKPIGNNKMQFSVPDKMLRLFILDTLEKNGSFADGSFNGNIVTVTPSDLLILLAIFENRQELLDHIHEQLKKQGKLLPIDLKNRLKDGFIALATDAGEKIAPNLTQWLKDWINTSKDQYLSQSPNN